MAFIGILIFGNNIMHKILNDNNLILTMLNLKFNLSNPMLVSLFNFSKHENLNKQLPTLINNLTLTFSLNILSLNK